MLLDSSVRPYNLSPLSYIRMLSLFPFLFSFSFFAPFLLRVTTGIIFFRLGYTAVRGKRTELNTVIKQCTRIRPRIIVILVGTLECTAGILLFFGLFTQIAALILFVLTMSALYVKYRFPDTLPHQLSFLSLLAVVLLSLLFSGAGALAIDLPL